MDIGSSLLQLGIGIAIGALFMAVFIWGMARTRLPIRLNQERARQALEEVVRRIAWADLDPTLEPRLRLVRSGYRGLLEYRSGVRPATDVTFDTAGGVAGWVHVATEGIGRGMIRVLRGTPWPTGDALFDESHEVSGSSEEFVRRVLNAESRSVLRSLGARGEILFRATARSMLLRVEWHLYDPGALESLVLGASSLFGALELPGGGHVQVVEMSESPEACCEVCGTALKVGALVRCRRCKTPHHRECWEFNGLCATFACGSREVV